MPHHMCQGGYRYLQRWTTDSHGNSSPFCQSQVNHQELSYYSYHFIAIVVHRLCLIGLLLDHLLFLLPASPNLLPARLSSRRHSIDANSDRLRLRCSSKWLCKSRESGPQSHARPEGSGNTSAKMRTYSILRDTRCREDGVGCRDQEGLQKAQPIDPP